MEAGDKLALHQVRYRPLAWVAFGGDAPASPSAHAVQVVLVHETGDAFAACRYLLVCEFCPDAGQHHLQVVVRYLVAFAIRGSCSVLPNN